MLILFSGFKSAAASSPAIKNVFQSNSQWEIFKVSLFLSKKCNVNIVPETFSQFFRPPEWGQIEGVIHTGSNYANFVWLMKFTVCLFVSFPLQVWLLHLPFISPVFWDLYTYKVLYSQFLTSTFGFYHWNFVPDERRLCLPLLASYDSPFYAVQLFFIPAPILFSCF